MAFSGTFGWVVAAWPARLGRTLARRFHGEKGDHLLMPSTGSAGDPLALPHLPEQPQALNPGPHQFHRWPSSLHPSPAPTFLKDPPSPLADLSPVHCSPLSTIPTSRPLSSALSKHLPCAISPGTQRAGKCCPHGKQLSQEAPPTPATSLASQPQPGGSPLPLIGHTIGHVLGVAGPWEPSEVHTEVPGEQGHVPGRGQMGPPCGGERGPEAWSSWLILTWAFRS